MTDVAHRWGADAVDEELSRLIEKRSRREPDPDEIEPGYVESVRRFNARRAQEMRAAWTSYHEGQAERHRRTLQDLIAHHEAQAAKLFEGEGVGFELH